MMRLRAAWERVRTTYWAVPSAMAAAASLLALGMIAVDRSLAAQVVDDLTWAYTGGPEGARAVLSAIASSMITVAGVTFSITIVALTLASQQFGPRLLRNFLRDLGNQVTLGTFIATFLYCLLVLRTVRGGDDEEFVPHLAVTLGVVLAMFSIGVLIFFIHHIATSIQASRIIANVSADLEAAIERLFPDRIGRGEDETAPPLPLPDVTRAHLVSAARSGYVQAVDGAALLACARDLDVVVRVVARPGTFVSIGRPLAAVSHRLGDARDVDDPVRAAFILGDERTGTQDVGFFIDQLVELAVRALSPGINDPATATACIDRLEQALCHLASRQMPSPLRFDSDGELRVVAEPVTLALMLDVALTEITRYARSSVSVRCRILHAVGELASCVSAGTDRLALVRHARAAGDLPGDSYADADRSAVAECYRAVLVAVGGGDDGEGAGPRPLPDFAP